MNEAEGIEIVRLEDAPRPDLVDRILEFGAEAGLDVDEEHELVELLQLLNPTGGVPVRAVLAVSELLNQLFRHERDAAAADPATTED